MSRVASPGKSGVGSAGGKIILLGEHSVVYGRRAIALGGERGAVASARGAASACLELGGQRHRPGVAAGAVTPGAAFAALLGEFPGVRPEVSAELRIPAGAGLGASAALGVAISRAISALVGGEPSEARVLRAADAWENVFHGRASGIDVAAAVRGGALLFSRSAGARALACPPKTPVVVAVAGPAASTERMVQLVARRRAVEPEDTERIFDRIDELVEGAVSDLECADYARLGARMVDNHQLLVRLGVSTPELDAACDLARRAGAFGAKLTGAGGGGCVVALCPHEARQAVLDAWGGRQLQCFELHQGARAVAGPAGP